MLRWNLLLFGDPETAVEVQLGQVCGQPGGDRNPTNADVQHSIALCSTCVHVYCCKVLVGSRRREAADSFLKQRRGCQLSNLLRAVCVLHRLPDLCDNIPDGPRPSWTFPLPYHREVPKPLPRLANAQQTSVDGDSQLSFQACNRRHQYRIARQPLRLLADNFASDVYLRVYLRHFGDAVQYSAVKYGRAA